MIGFIKTFLSILLSVLNVFTSPIWGDYSGKFEPIDADNCKLNFAAVSDIHMKDDGLRAFMLEFGLADMENADRELDALVCSGDLTDHGYAEEWEALVGAFEGYKPAKNIILAQGNHDTWTEDEGYNLAREYFIKYTEEITGRKIENEYYSTQVNGYTFIVLASEYDHTDMYISPAQLAWLEAEMAKAAKDGKPIFVISHWPINQSHGLPVSWGDEEYEPDEGGMGDQSDEVKAILKKYKNVFLITGHIHLGLKNEDQIGRYTYASVESDGSFHSVNLPTYMYVNIDGRIANGTGYQFEVYDDRVELRARSYSASVWYTDYNHTIPLV